MWNVIRSRSALFALSTVAFAACADSGMSGDGVGFATGPLMRPGEDCNFCHRPGSEYPSAPNWSLAGTVYPHKDAPSDEGVAGVKVIISDAMGEDALTLITNQVGNFYTSATLPSAYRVSLEYEGERITMPCTPPSAGCAKCHRASPIGFAPGRIFIPQGEEQEPMPFDCEAWMPDAGKGHAAASR
jgi:hypothetical protein